MRFHKIFVDIENLFLVFFSFVFSSSSSSFFFYVVFRWLNMCTEATHTHTHTHHIWFYSIEFLHYVIVVRLSQQRADQQITGFLRTASITMNLRIKYNITNTTNYDFLHKKYVYSIPIILFIKYCVQSIQ